MSIVRLIDSIITFSVFRSPTSPRPRNFSTCALFSRRRSSPNRSRKCSEGYYHFLCFLSINASQTKEEGRRTCGSEDSLIDVNQTRFGRSESSFTHLKINVSVLIHVECSEDVIAELLGVPGREEHLVPNEKSSSLVMRRRTNFSINSHVYELCGSQATVGTIALLIKSVVERGNKAERM